MFSLLAIVSFLVSYAQNMEHKNFKLTIKTNVNGNHPRLYLAYQINGQKLIDSAEYEYDKKGYVFEGNVVKPLLATLVSDPDEIGLSALIQKTRTGDKIDLLRLYLHPGNILLSTSGLLEIGKFTGSKINVDEQNLQRLLKPIFEKQMETSLMLRSNPDSLTATSLGARLDSLKDSRKPVLKSFITSNLDSYVSLVSLSEYAGPFPEVDDTYALFNKLSPHIRNTLLGQEYNKFLKDLQDLNIGTVAPEFIQNDTTGNPISLSSFRGKYVLLDFWASWCGPCREESAHMRQLYQDFSNRNFTILGISLDAADDKEAWIKAIKDDGLVWTQVSDLKHWDNSIVKLYSIKAIPQTFLIDPNGIIIARGLNYEELKDKLNTILPKND